MEDYTPPSPTKETPSERHHPSDILVTQTTICLAIVTVVFILNIFSPDTSEYLVETFKSHSEVELSDSIKYVLGWLYDRV